MKLHNLLMKLALLNNTGSFVKQGFIEQSNVDLTQTMTQMMNASRAFESNQKVIQAYDQSMDKAVNEIGTNLLRGSACMNIQMNSAATSMRELQKKIDVIANNVSNVNTTGYKRQEVNFSDTLTQSFDRQAGLQNEIGRMTPNGIRVGTGTKVTQTTLRAEQGSVMKTDRALDFMIQGDRGFFRVASEGNTYYTRDGSFQVQPILNSNQVNLVTSSGDSVLDINNVPIAFDADYDAIKVDENGMVEVSYK